MGVGKVREGERRKGEEQRTEEEEGGMWGVKESWAARIATL